MKTKATPCLLLLLLFAAFSFGCRNTTESAPQDYYSTAAPDTAAPLTTNTATDTQPDIAPDKTVYICVSKGAKRYHLSKACKGLNRCTHKIEAVTVKAAEGMGLTLCRWED